jgi:hypothetical protein
MGQLSERSSLLMLKSDMHAADNVLKARTAMKVLFGSDHTNLTAEALLHAFEGDPRLFKAPRKELIDVAIPRLIASAGHAKSKSERRTRLLCKDGTRLTNNASRRGRTAN